MRSKVTILLLLLALGYERTWAHNNVDEDSDYTHQEILEDWYTVAWKVDMESEVITFKIQAQTEGYVGFGINSYGGMRGGDMLIAGVFSNGSSYLWVSWT